MSITNQEQFFSQRQCEEFWRKIFKLIQVAVHVDLRGTPHQLRGLTGRQSCADAVISGLPAENRTDS